MPPTPKTPKTPKNDAAYQAALARKIPDAWRDPSGWRPTPLQMSVRPDAVGIPPDKWMFRQQLATPEQIRIWLSMLGKDKKKG